MYQPCQDAASATSHLSRQCLEPIVNILSGLILGDAVPLLDLAVQLVTTSIDDVEVVVGEMAPFLFDLALHLFPVSFNAIPIHEIPPVSLPQQFTGSYLVPLNRQSRGSAGALIGLPRELRTRDNMRAIYCENRNGATLKNVILRTALGNRALEARSLGPGWFC